MPYSQTFDPVNETAEFVIVSSEPTVRFTLANGLMTLAAHFPITRSRADFIRNVDEIVAWCQRINQLFGLPTVLTPRPYPFSYSLDMRRIPAQRRYTLIVGAFGFGFTYSYETDTVTILNRPLPETDSWDAWLFHLVHLQTFAMMLRML